MAVPSFDSLMLPVLQTLVDGNIHRPQEVSERVAAQLGVSAEDQAEMLPSGAMPRYRNRILWALRYMKRAGVIASPGRGQYVIADSGRALLAEAPAKVTIKMLERYTDKGVFFTTDKFTRPAIDFAKSIKKHIVLIDGPELARLMVRHCVGVTVTKTLLLARLDSDYFDSGMEA